uniref:Uncharacterized protein n=1 Tax=Schlesneria paludicola TaxID=360056 RepID=A0A7C2K0M7_9PLAN
MARHVAWAVGMVIGLALTAQAGVGDPQVRTDHPWYPGELACSTFERLFATQANLFERVTGARPRTDEDRALAAWMWRNLHYAHGEEGLRICGAAAFARATRPPASTGPACSRRVLVCAARRTPSGPPN